MGVSLMLVVISDLHFVDGTAGDHNVSCDAFLIWMDDVLTLAEDKKAKTLDFLFLGDIFDLIRTAKWFDVPLADRPWGDPDINEHPTTLTNACRAKALEILEAIATETKSHLEVLRGEHSGGRHRVAERLKALTDGETTVRRLYVPGNHDRLYVVDSAIRKRVDELLGLTPGPITDSPSDHLYASEAHGVVARHGHEFDVWNFEGYGRSKQSGQYDPLDYQRVPIGDVITTELVVRLPMEVRDRLRAAGVRANIVDGVYARLQNIENVRPTTAAIPWIWYEAGAMSGSGHVPGTATPWSDTERDAVVTIVQEAAGAVGHDFMSLPFVRRWIREHDVWGFGWDEADKLQAIHRLLRAGFGIRGLSKFLEMAEFVQRLTGHEDDPQRGAAFNEPLLASADHHYVVCGHTHQFEQVALKVVNGHEKLYLNSGTWRPRFFLADNKRDFVEWKEMTYLVFFAQDEDLSGFENPPRSKGRSMLTWTGTMLKRGRP
ncbi:MAG: hypothetical protein IT379_24220 [Deltaproteobacteria bacterium]|nr:hypothetical protein [Deltaproteobacteria bacterium]